MFHVKPIFDQKIDYQGSTWNKPKLRCFLSMML